MSLAFLRLSAVVAAAAVLAPAANAIPAFSRKYRTSCATCHLAFPVLNSFGKVFRARGYRMSGGDEQLTKEKPISLGAPAWKRVFPGSLWPSDIPGASVIGFWLSSGSKVKPNAPTTNEFEGITGLNLLSAGTIGESFSFYMDVSIVNAGALPAKASDAVDRAFFQYNHSSHKVNLTVGVFEPRAVITSSHLRLMGISDYLANVYGMPPTGNSFSLSPNQQGIEGWGNVEGPRHRGGLEWFAGVVNGRDAGVPTGAAAYNSEDLGNRVHAALGTAWRCRAGSTATS